MKDIREVLGGPQEVRRIISLLPGTVRIPIVPNLQTAWKYSGEKNQELRVARRLLFIVAAGSEIMATAE